MVPKSNCLKAKGNATRKFLQQKLTVKNLIKQNAKDINNNRFAVLSNDPSSADNNKNTSGVDKNIKKNKETHSNVEISNTESTIVAEETHQSKINAEEDFDKIIQEVAMLDQEARFVTLKIKHVCQNGAEYKP